MSTENYLPKLGQLCDDSDRRDAVHIALAPVLAGQDLLPGSRVTINKNGEAVWDNVNVVGIVDPFLPPEVVKKGERFWLMLLPGTITGLRHVWSHNAFKVKLPGATDE